MKKNQIVYCEIFGRTERCRVLAVHGKSTLDVQRLRDGECFRIAGLSIIDGVITWG